LADVVARIKQEQNKSGSQYCKDLLLPAHANRLNVFQYPVGQAHVIGKDLIELIFIEA
jgi:hypothetical protein